jgi:hypothetical protein
MTFEEGYAKGRDEERERCRRLIIGEYLYWRDARDFGVDEIAEGMLTAIQIGAAGAVANVLAAVCGFVRISDEVKERNQ